MKRGVASLAAPAIRALVRPRPSSLFPRQRRRASPIWRIIRRPRQRNHEIVREILPKGVSFDALTQEQAYLALSHVNAYVRLAQGDRTPFEVFEFLYGEGTAAKLHIARIDPRKVVLKPWLVGIEMK